METVLHAMESGAGAPLAFGSTVLLGLVMLCVAGAVRRLRRPLVAALAPIPTRPDAWATPGVAYYCNSRCGFAFYRRPGGAWERHGAGLEPRTLMDWETLEDQYADCAGHLLRKYGKMEP